MNRAWIFAIGLVCGVSATAMSRIAAHLGVLPHGGYGARTPQNGERAHTVETFAFTANASLERVAPLFGAEKERAWAPKWDPHFVHPQPATDEQGMVFTVAHDHLQSVWVNTVLDLKNGRMQYVYVIPDALVTVIELKLTPAGNQTQVEVEYERTALSAQADEHVRQMAERDRASGPEWEQQVNQYLEQSR